jgi:ferredoxin-NADP reductase
VTDLQSAPPAPIGGWQSATVTRIHRETSTAKTFSLRLERPTPYLAGQHLIVRLSAPDGYSASRSYSIASAPGSDLDVDLTVERLPGGEVSMFLDDDVVVGDVVEVRGPIGLWFVWRADTPALLIGGGSGIVPLMAMLRLARRLGRSSSVRLLVSVRTPDVLYYASELPGPETSVIYTRASPADSPRPTGRLTRDDVAPLVDLSATAYICGSSPFCDAAAEIVMDCGLASDRIRIERFGPSG